MATIHIEDVSKNFGTFHALKNIFLSAEDKEFTALLGPSGSGKTTLLRTVAGLEQASSGRISIGAMRVDNLAPKDRHLAMVFQNYAVFPHMTVADNISFGLKTKGALKEYIAEHTQRTAALLHIEDVLHKYPNKLSGGQRQRVSVARALAVQPQVLLMDEPLSNLDALLRLEMRSELKALLKKSETTTLYVTHDQIEAMSMADKIAVMNNGEIMQYGPPEEIYFKPKHEFVARFIGSPPMNLFTVQTLKTVNKKTFAVINNDIAFVIEASLKTKIQENFDACGVLVGIRPEQLSFKGSASHAKTFADASTIQSEVLTIEQLGSNTLLVLKSNEILFRVMEKYGIKIDLNDRVTFGYQPNQLSWFGKDSGMHIEA